jgi:Na+/proline symporter
MATQMSAVTLVGTTGQAHSTGLRFIQFYFGLPLAMVILSVTLVPFFHRARSTADEYSSDGSTRGPRTLSELPLLMGRAFSSA